MKRKGLLCLLALLLFLMGFLLIENLRPASAPAPKATAQGTISAHPQNVSLVSAISAVQEEVSSATQARPMFVPGSQSLHVLPATSLNSSHPGTRRILNALLIPAMARLIGLSHIVLRE